MCLVPHTGGLWKSGFVLMRCGIPLITADIIGRLGAEFNLGLAKKTTDREILISLVDDFVDGNSSI
jgi:hypothetical protein